MVKYINSTKKCPHCKQWSEWHGGADEKCEHCGEYLDPKAAGEHKEFEATKDLRKGPIKFIVEIKPDDNPVIAFLKRMVQVGQIVFVAILSFILWVVTIVTG